VKTKLITKTENKNRITKENNKKEKKRIKTE